MLATAYSRRSVVAGMGGIAAGLGLARAGFAQSPAPPGTRTRLILLGTKGGPRPVGTRHAPAQVILVDNEAYVIDCGNGVAWQMTAAKVPLARLRHVFITHHHSDHNADYGNLLLLSWASGMQHRVDTWGPPPLSEMTRLYFEMNRVDIEGRIADVGWKDLRTLVVPHDVAGPGPVMQDDRIRVTAALVNHPPIVPSFAYRFDGPDRSIVISGDTTPSDNLVELARGADVLVHEAINLDGLERLVANTPNPAKSRAHQLGSHTPVAEAGKIATRAGVKTLVLSHLVPGDDPLITDRMWIDEARKTFAGEVILGRDLKEI